MEVRKQRNTAHSHARTARAYIGTPCLITEHNAYPYECVAKDRDPDANVVVCEAHGAWWVKEDWDHV